MKFEGFNEADFAVFDVDGLENRMNAIIKKVRPKLETLGEHFSTSLSVWTGEEMIAHVAKHARRSVNPPDDTWVAFANSKRGYKKLPHFQIGLWKTHLFIWFAVIYESPIKEEFGRKLEKNYSKIVKNIPDTYMWSDDHTKPDSMEQNKLKKRDFTRMFTRLKEIKKAEILCGVHLSREEVLSLSGDDQLKKMEETLQNLLPLYQLAQK
ncbi:YktB family protein [Metabacillus sp. RGM 3146]|uniref:YktB family protein n=1 Tax=Metabacillus sp. RGM 3146 TaxID=3401092 RepID=UPI003B997431